MIQSKDEEDAPKINDEPEESDSEEINPEHYYILELEANVDNKTASKNDYFILIATYKVTHSNRITVTYSNKNNLTTTLTIKTVWGNCLKWTNTIYFWTRRKSINALTFAIMTMSMISRRKTRPTRNFIRTWCPASMTPIRSWKALNLSRKSFNRITSRIIGNWHKQKPSASHCMTTSRASTRNRKSTRLTYDVH